MLELSANARRRAIRPRTRIGVGAVVLALGLSTAALGMTATGSAATATSNWTQPDVAAGRTRFNPNETVLGKSNVGTLHVAWRLKGDGNCTPWFGTVANGLVYVGECDTPAVSAYDLATGHLRWHQDVPGQDWAA